MNILNTKDLLKYFKETPNVSFSIDRYEENFVVCENRLTSEMILVSRDLVPSNAKPGDILILEKDKLIIDIKTTKDQQEDIKSLVDQLFKRKS